MTMGSGAAGWGGLGRHLLLRRRLEVAGGSGPSTQALHRVGHVLLLAKHGVAQLLGPFELVAHHRQNLGEGDQRLDADIPTLVLDRRHRGIALEIGISLHPTRRLDDLQRIGRCHQHLRQQRVRIECDRRQHLVELLGRERLWRVLGFEAYERAGGQNHARQHQEPASIHVPFPGYAFSSMPPHTSGRNIVPSSLSRQAPITPGGRLRPDRRAL